MDERARGLILRLYPLTETSLIIHWLTPGFGRVATVAKGARRPKSPFAGKLDLFFVADFTFQRSRRSELHTLKEVALLETHSFLRRDLQLLRQAAYCSALIEQTTERETPLQQASGLMEGLLQSLAALSGAETSAAPVLGFELKLLDELGMKPELGKTTLSATARALAIELTEGDWASLAALKPEALWVKELRQFLHGFLIFHLGRIPKGRHAALNG